LADTRLDRQRAGPRPANWKINWTLAVRGVQHCRSLLTGG